MAVPNALPGQPFPTSTLLLHWLSPSAVVKPLEYSAQLSPPSAPDALGNEPSFASSKTGLLVLWELDPSAKPLLPCIQLLGGTILGLESFFHQ